MQLHARLARGTAAKPFPDASRLSQDARARDCLGMCKVVDLPCVASSAAHKKRRKFTIRSVTTYSAKIKHKTTPVTLNRPRSVYPAVTRVKSKENHPSIPYESALFALLNFLANSSRNIDRRSRASTFSGSRKDKRHLQDR
jgi:hypothetical protein